ncbi:helix-turn-helix domain-containing protein [uncultured Jatrophihabitans sp.]|uniref:helix-turn-helix transcriptional regulator n=1 Tax=uncultured Jatrophihabitans sp. TaxID=1610747 RepID=UPI0035CA9144
MSDSDELAEQDVALYRAVLRAPDTPLPDIVEAMPQPAQELDKSVARLADMGLLRIDGGESLTAVSPMVAEATVLGVEDLEIAARRAALEQRRDTIRRLVPDYNDVLAEVEGDGNVDIVDASEGGSITTTMLHYAEQCEFELLSVAPGRVLDERGMALNRYPTDRGPKTRAIYQHSALRDRATRAHLDALADSGARIRIAGSVPGRSLVVDRGVALLPLPDETDPQAQRSLAVVRAASVIAWMVATFEQLWAQATPLADVVDRPADAEVELDSTRAAILRLMAEGEKDEAISRRLSISVRTCRRHIADYMSAVGANSRFQAGVIAARSGHAAPLDAPPGVGQPSG